MTIVLTNFGKKNYKVPTYQHFSSSYSCSQQSYIWRGGRLEIGGHKGTIMTFDFSLHTHILPLQPRAQDLKIWCQMMAISNGKQIQYGELDWNWLKAKFVCLACSRRFLRFANSPTKSGRLRKQYPLLVSAHLIQTMELCISDISPPFPVLQYWIMCQRKVCELSFPRKL